VDSCSGSCCNGPYYENKTEVAECLPEYDRCECELPPSEKCYKWDRYYERGDQYYRKGDAYYWKGDQYYEKGDQYYEKGEGTIRCRKHEYYPPYCSQCDPQRILLAKKLDKIFVSDILDAPNSRVGLVGYGTSICGITRDLTNNKDLLEDTIDDYQANCNKTCISCSVQEGIEILNEGDATNKYLVVMSDGDANCLIDGSCGEIWEDEARQEAIDKSCEAWEDYGIKVYTIGFGREAGSETLEDMAECGNGEFYNSSDAAELESIYKEIAEKILEASYTTQAVNITGNVTFNNILYPDSYIELNYTPITKFEYGEISLTRETDRLKKFTDDDVDKPYKEGWYNISEKIRVVDAKITSYSSEYWTDRLLINSSITIDWKEVYNLSDYVIKYQDLGDPYIVQIPADLIGSGNNSVRIGTGFSTANATGGSPDDRVIYTMAVKGSVGWGNVNESMEVAIEDAINRLNNTVRGYVNFTIDDVEMTSSNIRGIRWLWGPSLLKTVVWEKH